MAAGLVLAVPDVAPGVVPVDEPEVADPDPLVLPALESEILFVLTEVPR